MGTELPAPARTSAISSSPLAPGSMRSHTTRSNDRASRSSSIRPSVPENAAVHA